MQNHYLQKLIPRLFILLLVGGIAFSSGGCKNKKKLAQEAAAKEYADKVDKAIAELEAILNDDGTMPLTEMERRLADVRSLNLNDSKVNDLITRVEDKIKAKKAALKKLEEEEAARKKTESKTGYDYINDYFVQIAGAGSTEKANAKIEEARKLYVSGDVPVLIIIHQEGEITDYDKPTTIDKYLNFVKDQKKYNNRINSVKFDAYGQITELELIKN
jgi:hypothetical protein